MERKYYGRKRIYMVNEGIIFGNSCGNTMFEGGNTMNGGGNSLDGGRNIVNGRRKQL